MLRLSKMPKQNLPLNPLNRTLSVGEILILPWNPTNTGIKLLDNLCVFSNYF